MAVKGAFAAFGLTGRGAARTVVGMPRSAGPIVALSATLLAGCANRAAHAELSRARVGGNRVMVTGTLIVASGDAPAGVAVHVYHPDAVVPWLASTGADGRFELPHVLPGRLVIAVDPWTGGVVRRVKPLGEESAWVRFRCERRRARFEPAGCWVVRAPAGAIIRLRITLDHLRRPTNVLWGATASPGGE